MENVIVPSCVASMEGISLHVVTFDPSMCSAGLDISADNRCVTQVLAIDANRCVFGTQALCAGCHYWSFSVDQTSGCQTTIGVSTGGSEPTPKSNAFGGSKDDGGVSLCLDGSVRHRGSSLQLVDAARVRSSKHVGVLLNLKSASCSFFADGVQLGTVVMSENFHPHADVYPIVSFHNKDCSVFSDQLILPAPEKPHYVPIPLPPSIYCDTRIASHTFPFDPSNCSPGLILSDANVMISCPTVVVNDVNPMASVCHSAGSLNSGLHYWSYRIVRRGAATMVGLAFDPIRKKSHATKCCGGGSSQYTSWVLLCVGDGTIRTHKGSIPLPQAARAKTAEHIGILANISERGATCTFFADNELLGTAANEEVLSTWVPYHPIVSIHDKDGVIVCDALIDDRPSSLPVKENLTGRQKDDDNDVEIRSGVNATCGTGSES